MSLFISRLKKWTRVDSVFPTNHVRIKSFNHNSNLEKIEYLIIGTLTPCSGRNENNYEEGYYYCGKENWMYEFIDYSFKEKDSNNLVKAKESFRKTWGDPLTIKWILSERKIGFLDVIKEGIVHIDDPSDDSIAPFVLDYATFKDAEKIINRLFEKGRIRANSKNAAEAFKEITGKAIPIIPQRIRRHFTDTLTGKSYNSKADLREGWRDFFN